MYGVSMSSQNPPAVVIGNSTAALPASERPTPLLQTASPSENPAVTSDDYSKPNRVVWPCYMQTYDELKHRWGEKRRVQLAETVECVVRDTASPAIILRQTLHLPLGGTIDIFPNWLNHTEIDCKALQKEMLESTYWRQYMIQGNQEPRTHFLLHDDATGDFYGDPQPGYSYSRLRIKSRPLENLPFVQDLAYTAQSTCRVPQWNVGVQAVLYRDGKDYIGLHADDDQGEESIFTAVIRTSDNGRTTIVVPKRRPYEDGDQKFLLELRAGDAYQMNGKMQQNYLHSVLLFKQGLDDPNECRLSIVCRFGRLELIDNDNGAPLISLRPRPSRTPCLGNNIPGLFEGVTYTRVKLDELRAHVGQQRSVSGSIERGCEALIVSSKREDGGGADVFARLIYLVEANKGGGSILTNIRNGEPIRIFRSSSQTNTFPARMYSKTQAGYRYDGIYSAVSVTFFDESAGKWVTEVADNVSRPRPRRLYYFRLYRIQKGPDLRNNNKLSAEELAATLGATFQPQYSANNSSQASMQPASFNPQLSLPCSSHNVARRIEPHSTHLQPSTSLTTEKLNATMEQPKYNIFVNGDPTDIEKCSRFDDPIRESCEDIPGVSTLQYNLFFGRQPITIRNSSNIDSLKCSGKDECDLAAQAVRVSSQQEQNRPISRCSSKLCDGRITGSDQCSCKRLPDRDTIHHVKSLVAFKNSEKGGTRSNKFFRNGISRRFDACKQLWH